MNKLSGLSVTLGVFESMDEERYEGNMAVVTSERTAAEHLAPRPATPLTDAAFFSTYDGFSKRAPTIRVVRVEFARKLERDRRDLGIALREYEAAYPHGRLGEHARALLARMGATDAKA